MTRSPTHHGGISGIGAKSKGGRDQRKMAQVAKIQCAVCDSRLDLHRHHIVPRSLTRCDDAENLIVLCGEDHKRAHRREIDLGLYVTPAQGAKVVLLLKTVRAADRLLYPSDHPYERVAA